MKLSVHLLYPLYDDTALAQLRAKLHPAIHITAGLDLPTPADYQILIAGRPGRKHVVASPDLRSLVVPWAGIPESTRELMLEFPHITVHNLHHNALPVAEHVIALLLAAAKFIVPMDRSMRNGDWTPRYDPSPSILLEGRKALVLGYGVIGQKVAQLCLGLGMEVLAIRRRVASPPVASQSNVPVAPVEELHHVLPRADVLLICLPHTPETTGFIGAEELALLPPTAVLINVGRGPIVDEAALYHALNDRTLYAAGLDVWYDYPANEAARAHTPPSAYPFHQLDNIVMSPHRAGGSVETEKLRMIHLAELLNTAARGEPMPNRVDLQIGY